MLFFEWTQGGDRVQHLLSVSQEEEQSHQQKKYLKKYVCCLGKKTAQIAGDKVHGAIYRIRDIEREAGDEMLDQCVHTLLYTLHILTLVCLGQGEKALRLGEQLKSKEHHRHYQEEKRDYDQKASNNAFFSMEKPYKLFIQRMQ